MDLFLLLQSQSNKLLFLHASGPFLSFQRVQVILSVLERKESLLITLKVFSLIFLYSFERRRSFFTLSLYLTKENQNFTRKRFDVVLRDHWKFSFSFFCCKISHFLIIFCFPFFLLRKLLWTKTVSFSFVSDEILKRKIAVVTL